MEISFQGGLIKEPDSDHLLIALEPEAASLYVRKMDIENDTSTKSIKSGTKYLVIDAGGKLVCFIIIIFLLIKSTLHKNILIKIINVLTISFIFYA